MNLDLTPTPTSTKSTDDTEVDDNSQDTSPLSYTNGAQKNHHQQPPLPPAPPAYIECMKNHAASIGGHAVDGCGEFMPTPSATTTNPISLKCAACGCHRNFHRREPESPAAAITPPFLDFRHPPLPKRFSLSASPPPPPAAVVPTPYAPHFLFSLSTGVGAEEHHQAPVTPTAENPVGRKRFRSKFSQEQKEKMHSFSEKLGWKMHKSDEAAVKDFCDEIGVTKGVLKVWMHNNKTTFGRKEIHSGGGGDTTKSTEERENDNNGGHFQNYESGNGAHFHSSNNGSSSSL